MGLEKELRHFLKHFKERNMVSNNRRRHNKDIQIKETLKSYLQFLQLFPIKTMH